MSDDYDVDENDDSIEDEPTEPQPDRNPLRSVNRRLEKENKALRLEAAAGKDAVRRLAFNEAGIDLTAPGAKSFVKAYDGELTPDAIKAAAAEDGLIAAPAEDPISPEEKAAHGRLAGTGQGTPPGVSDIDTQIAEATAAGNHLGAIALKTQRAAEARARNSR